MKPWQICMYLLPSGWRSRSHTDTLFNDRTDRLAYIFSLIGDLESQHGKRLEKSRSDLKRIQKAEMDLAPKRNARVKIHKELVTLIPERAKIESSKIAPLEAQQATLEREDKVQEEDLSKLKREALKSSYDAQSVSLALANRSISSLPDDLFQLRQHD